MKNFHLKVNKNGILIGVLDNLNSKLITGAENPGEF